IKAPVRKQAQTRKKARGDRVAEKVGRDYLPERKTVPLLAVLAPVPVGIVIFPDIGFVEVPSYTQDVKHRRDAYEEEDSPAEIEAVERDIQNGNRVGNPFLESGDYKRGKYSGQDVA